MLKKLLIGLLAMAAILASIYARQGASFALARSVDIRAAPARIAPLVARLRLPPAMARLGHASPIQASVTLAPAGTLTRVTWRVAGPLTLRTRLIGALIGMDALLGSDLDKGLAGVKAAAEKPAP